MGRFMSQKTDKIFRSWRMNAALGLLLLGGAGCQTFSLSEEQWQKQQHGGVVDQRTGDLVGTAGSAGYYGFMIGETVAAALKK